MKYFTSDWHIGHENVIKFSDRPFKSIEAMNQTIIDMVLDTVKKGDRYYWLKLQTNFFDSQDIRALEPKVDGERYIIFWLKLLLLAVKQDDVGILRYKETIPYNAEILSTVTNTDIDTVRSAMTIFQKFGMIEIQENGDIWLEDVVKMVGSESESAHRVRKLRAKKKELKQLEDNTALHCNVEKSKRREEIEKKREENNRKEKNSNFSHISNENDSLKNIIKADNDNTQKKDIDEKKYIPSPLVQNVIDKCIKKNDRKLNDIYK